MKSIVVATDLSERSDRAVHRALLLAAEHKARLHVISIVDSALPDDLARPLRVSVQERLPRQIDALNTGAAYDVTVKMGDISQVLGEFIVEKEADLVVLGLHRPRTFLDSLRETTMERLVASSTVPVLLVKNAADHAYDSALSLVSYSPACAVALESAHVLAPEASLTALHALYVPYAGLTGGDKDSEMARAVLQEAEAASAKWLKTVSVPQDAFETDIRTGGLRGVVHQAISTDKPDLLAIGAHSRSGLFLHRIGGFAAELVREPPTDLLIAPPIST